jgi:hypothetical protein
VYITAEISNLGEVADNYTAVVKVDGNMVDKKDFFIGPSENITLEYTINEAHVGQHSVYLNSSHTNFIIYPMEIELYASKCETGADYCYVRGVVTEKNSIHEVNRLTMNLYYFNLATLNGIKSFTIKCRREDSECNWAAIFLDGNLDIGSIVDVKISKDRLDEQQYDINREDVKVIGPLKRDW